jgi:hypothetical protein
LFFKRLNTQNPKTAAASMVFASPSRKTGTQPIKEIRVMPKINRATQQDRDRKMIAAIQKYLMSIVSILVRGVGYTPAQLITLLQNDIAAADAATKAKAALHDAVIAAKTQRATMTPLLTGFRTYILNQFKDASIISDFGFTPQKEPARTVADKATAATKAKATRTARHTMGAKQKKSVTGTTTAPTAATSVTTVPVTTASTPAAASKPAQ